jgi:hypothetical protein
MFARPCTPLLQMISHLHCLCGARRFLYVMSYDDYKNYLSTAPGNKIINQSLTPYYQIRSPSPVLSRNSFRTTPKQRAKDETQRNKRGCPFLLIKGTCAQTQYKIPYFLPAVRSIEYRVWVSPCRRARPCPEFQASI